MSEMNLLSPRQAEGVVDERIQQFGLGALPHVEVALQPDGMWHIKWEDRQSVVPPMTMEAWCAWLEENVGSLDAGDLETTES
jgi:hypothetical protein